MNKTQLILFLSLAACGSMDEVRELHTVTESQGLGTPFYPAGTVSSAGSWDRNLPGIVIDCAAGDLNSSAGCYSPDGGTQIVFPGNFSGMVDGEKYFTYLGFRIDYCRLSGSSTANGQLGYQIHYNDNVYSTWQYIPISTTASCGGTRSQTYHFFPWGSKNVIYTNVIQLSVHDDSSDSGATMSLYNPVFQGIYEYPEEG